MKRNDHPTIGRRGRLARSLATATSLARSSRRQIDRRSKSHDNLSAGGIALTTQNTTLPPHGSQLPRQQWRDHQDSGGTAATVSEGPIERQAQK